RPLQFDKRKQSWKRKIKLKGSPKTQKDTHKPINSRAPMNKTDAGRPEKSEPDRAEHPTLFGPPPLFDGEDTEIYDQLVREISTAVTPADIFENIWVRDVVDLTLEVFRLRRLTA